jgi:hypothetical protein
VWLALFFNTGIMRWAMGTFVGVPMLSVAMFVVSRHSGLGAVSYGYRHRIIQYYTKVIVLYCRVKSS